MPRGAAKQKILITGGAGFIGSHIASACLKAGHAVAVVDNLSTGKKENVPEGASFYQADICDAKAMEKIFEKEKPDVVNHHAGQIDVRRSVENPLEDAQINILGGLNLLEISRKAAVKKWIYASTGGAIYGEVLKTPPDEKTKADPISHYGTSKFCLENYIELYGRLYNLDYTILRYANVYGPRQIPKAEGGVIAIFIDALLNDESPVVFGDGKQSRDFVYVEDIAAANVKAVAGASQKVLNLAGGRETSVLELFGALKKELKFRGSPKFAPKRSGEILRSVLNPAEAKKVLNWEAKTSLKEGLKKTIHWTRNL